METSAVDVSRSGFQAFYQDHFLAEHQQPANVALHVVGTIASAVFLLVAVFSPMPWLALFYPVVHAAPGLLGHRLFERNQGLGDVRVLRRDFPPWWFIAGNHLMTWQLVRALFQAAR